jgi:hypothetical protein
MFWIWPDTGSCIFVSKQTKTKQNQKLFEFVEFKRQITPDLVTPWCCQNNKLTPEKQLRSIANEGIHYQTNYIFHSHLQNNTKKRKADNDPVGEKPPSSGSDGH